MEPRRSNLTGQSFGHRTALANNPAFQRHAALTQYPQRSDKQVKAFLFDMPANRNQFGRIALRAVGGRKEMRVETVIDRVQRGNRT